MCAGPKGHIRLDPDQTLPVKGFEFRPRRSDHKTSYRRGLPMLFPFREPVRVLDPSPLSIPDVLIRKAEALHYVMKFVLEGFLIGRLRKITDHGSGLGRRFSEMIYLGPKGIKFVEKV